MAQYTLKQGQEVINAELNEDNTFFANEDNLDSGDVINGGNKFDIFRFFADDRGGNFAAFELNRVERLEVTNDAANPIRFDLSGSLDLRQFAVNNSSQSVTFAQIAQLDSATRLDIINTTTVQQTDVTMQFRDLAVKGTNSVTVNVEDTDVDTVRIGSVSDANGGVEDIKLNVTGLTSVIDTFDTDATSLSIAGDATMFEIRDALNSSVQRIDARAFAGTLTLDFSAASATTRVLGSAGSNIFTGGEASDRVKTFGAADVLDLGNGNNVVNAGDGDNSVTTGVGGDHIMTGIGDDTIRAGDGRNRINAGDGNNSITSGSGADKITGGSGVDRVDSGDGNDTIRTLAGADVITVGTGRQTVDAGADDDTLIFGDDLDASVDVNGNPIRDVVDGGTGSDTLQIDAFNPIGADAAPPSDQRDDARFDQVRSIETLQILTAGRTFLGGANSLLGLDNAQAAGIRTVQLFAAGNDDVDASTFSSDLMVDSFNGGSDTVRTGSGTDVVDFHDALDDTDVIDGGLQSGIGDILRATGTTTLTAASGFSNFEILRLASGYDLNGIAAVYNVTLDDDNASSTGTLTVDASGLKRRAFGAETLTLDASAVTSYHLVVTSGNANDVIQGGALSDTINSGSGNDTVTAVGGDLVNAGAGNDTILLVSGNNTAIGDRGQDTIVLGTGSDTVDAGEDNDLIVAGSARAADQLTAADAVNGGSGTDTLRVQGLALADADFTNVSSIETLDVTGRGGTVVIGMEAEAAGIRTVILSNSSASELDASGYQGGLVVHAEAGGDDQIATGKGDDTVFAGVGNETVTLGDGADTYVVDGTELDNVDTVDGGAGSDTIQLDNLDENGNGVSVSATVDLDNVRSVERYAFAGDGHNPNNPLGDVTDVYTLSFNASEDSIGSQTDITIDLSKLADTHDVTQVTLEEGLSDADYRFTITGSSTSTEVFKYNFGVNNDIRFMGGGGADALYISGSDLGSTTIFDGGSGAGRDAIHQMGGLVTDDSYASVTNVEVLTATGGDAVRAILGTSASMSGLESVIFDNGNANSVRIDAGYTKDLEVILGDGNDVVDADEQVTAALTIVANVSQITAADRLDGGSTGGDTLELHIQGDATADLTNMTRVETITMIDDTLDVVRTQTHLILDTTLNDVFGGTQTIDAANAQDGYYIDAATATANLVINLSESGNTPIDVVVTGSGNDTIDLGSAGFGGSDYGVAPDTIQDHVDSGDGNDAIRGAGGMIATGNGNDTVILDDTSFAPNSQISLGAGNDVAITSNGSDIVKGDAGLDTIRTGGGSDAISGGQDIDTIEGGDGNDFISGGAGADILDGGSGASEAFDGADQFFYGAVSDSSTPTGRDTINGFVSGVDKVDFRDLVTPASLGAISFVGNAENFADAQGSVTQGSGLLQVVFEADRNILWADANDDGTLDANDIQIKLTGVSSISAADVFSGADTTAGGQNAFDVAHGLNTDFFTSSVVLA